MSTRIRYQKHSKRENVLESVQTFISDSTGAKYKVRLDLNNMMYEIKNLRSEKLHKGGEGINNLAVLKRNAKKHLSKLGVKFDGEDRKRTFGLCEKGYNQDKHLENKYEGLRDIIRLKS
jgi:hypothetical protein